jgi:hypothetical protein
MNPTDPRAINFTISVEAFILIKIIPREGEF